MHDKDPGGLPAPGPLQKLSPRDNRDTLDCIRPSPLWRFAGEANMDVSHILLRPTKHFWVESAMWSHGVDFHRLGRLQDERD